MSKKRTLIAPIALDLGAKSTGLYATLYPKGSTLDKVKENAQVATLELGKDSYTFLMADRTASRHQRRGFDRKQMVKRLFKLIWTKELKIPWDAYIQQSLSFLLNRRGFSFLTEEYDPQLLEQAPKELKEELNNVLEKNNYTGGNLNEFLQGIDEKEKAEEIAEKLHKKEVSYRLRSYCEKISTDNKTVNKKLKEYPVEDFKLLKEDFHEHYEKIKDGSYMVEDADGNPKQVKYKQKNKINLQKYLEKHKQLVEELLEKLNSDKKWNFTTNSFKLDEKAQEILADQDHNHYLKTHLQHFVFAVHKVKQEFESGARHRSTYFQEINEVLEEDKHREKYLQTFCKNLQAKKYKGLTPKSLGMLLGNISNMELKPLRKYFNDKKHAQGDYWDKQRFTRIYANWILNEWRVGPKDTKKAKDAAFDYAKFKKEFIDAVGKVQELKDKQAKGCLIEFLSELNPNKTIPPYQDNNNRKPPKCQSLILNPTYLDAKYPEWQSWLKQLKEAKHLENELATYYSELEGIGNYFQPQKSKKKNIYSGQRDYKDLDARLLQFVFDRVKVSDKFRLNEIYSQAKKLKQNVSSESAKKDAERQLNKQLNETELPDDLKSVHQDGIFAEQSFLHLVCKYYKLRQRAKDGRLFIQPEYRYNKKEQKYHNTGRFEHAHHLLTYCNHKPRQKRYQLKHDLAGVLQINPKNFIEKVQEYLAEEGIACQTEEQQIEAWIKQFKIGTICKKAVELQKTFRGTLKSSLDKAQFKVKLDAIKKKKNKASEEENTLVTIYANMKGLSAEEKILVKTSDECKKKATQIGETLGINSDSSNKFSSIFSFAQIQQIAFTDRQGNASTCAVCSSDNAYRMQQDAESAKAQRLPAVATRVIDGAVKKMARILARTLANRYWKPIQKALKAEQPVVLPLILESNAFEFEPNLADIKGTKLKTKRENALKKAQPSELFTAKNNRIKASTLGISAYGGDSLDGEEFNSMEEEIDHIIPRSAEYGVLNDEANLICVTRADNQTKGDRVYTLKGLSRKYKLLQFGTEEDEAIEQQIRTTIWDENQQRFSFGQYRSFINLDRKQQQAFRHALFLPQDNEVRKAVLQAIQNRNRAFVNGTQRYVAQEIANAFYLQAKKENLDTSLLSFDFFGIPTTDSRGRGIADVRWMFEQTEHPSFKDFTKKEGKSQYPYSHALDAMLAFCIAADNHQNDGSMGVNISQAPLMPYSQESGEVYDNTLFEKIQIEEERHKKIELGRRIPHPRSFQASNRPLFNENAVALHFLKLIEIENLKTQETTFIKGHLGLGDLQKVLNELHKYPYGEVLKASKNKELISLYKEEFLHSSQTLLDNTDFRITLYSLDKKKICDFLIAKFSAGCVIEKSNQDDLAKLKLLYTLWYFTQRRNVVAETNGKLSLYKIQDRNLKCGGFPHPQLTSSWNNLAQSVDNDNLKESVRKFFQQQHPYLGKNHYKKRKDFSLPIAKSKGYLVKKEDWQGNVVYYIRPASNDFSQTALHKADVPKTTSKEKDERLVNAYRQKNLVHIASQFNEFKKQMRQVEETRVIDPNHYYQAQVPAKYSKYIEKADNKRTDATRPQFRFFLNQKERMEFKIFKEFIMEYRPRILQDLSASLREEWIEQKIVNDEDLENTISELRNSKTPPPKVLRALELLNALWLETQNARILEIQAAHTFTYYNETPDN